MNLRCLKYLVIQTIGVITIVAISQSISLAWWSGYMAGLIAANWWYILSMFRDRDR